ncbi:hypothetical protein A2837_01050 [Candidatus Kaiserbacteria bacterium RIFCSPHIGHO2_01_FULL_46_22]|uniref:Nudix hydrolase domain-containing protein n=1 Tax=Candidatus Kaiserbacteria bacterium RIFCSPHIGHO2_01_FULL_46_22 TaxID=1798475 RepID=A0A1F6BXU2_9BACT|nr:MAG: hypothetical protein A2837_01050 [Candidatus Kaiserbacteria bacterium RIFCSPHIGHO2_01_FULL_46_22]
MKRYTVGLIFNSTLTEVVLMDKTHPDWQKGKLNGIGGRIEDGESSVDCIVRETREETDLETISSNWQLFATIAEGDSEVDFFGLVHFGSKDDIKTVTDEKVSWYPVKAIPENAIMNIHWLIPMAMEKLKGGIFDIAKIKYK